MNFMEKNDSVLMSTSTILKAENISKQYRLGTIGSGSLGDDLKRWWYQIRGKEDPFLKVGAVNDRSSIANEDYIWALRDIHFEVKQGEVLGIIGKNGAGKSTLLKILSKVTSPTTGSIRTRGRIASLLEVGTGFHGELTGRENIFMNGAVLGMTRREIKSKLEEIISFSGCEKYIDTPVKRYSSGMTVRLAFAVAAHLEPEILVIDEVLAVGDAEFQRKALGKMQNLSVGEGRTVLFVSHNMDSVIGLCTKAILLKNGMIIDRGDTSSIVESYLQTEYGITTRKKWEVEPEGNPIVRMDEVKVHDADFNVKENFDITETIGISMTYEVLRTGYRIHSAFNFYNRSGINLFDSHEYDTTLYSEKKSKGFYRTTVWIPANFLSVGVIILGAALVTHNPFIVHFHEKDVIAFNMMESFKNSPTRGEYIGVFPGVVRPFFNWESEEKFKNV